MEKTYEIITSNLPSKRTAQSPDRGRIWQEPDATGSRSQKSEEIPTRGNVRPQGDRLPGALDSNAASS